MKLTKGKISKLYSKKRQSLKKHLTNNNILSERKTFRKIKKLNLARKSIKKFHHKKYSGGTPTEITELKTPLLSTIQLLSEQEGVSDNQLDEPVMYNVSP